MKIRVVTAYRGVKTAGHTIQPGVYFDTDGTLYGLADWLVQTGRAVVVQETDDTTASKTIPAKRKRVRTDD
jgi:hypothetical protein